MSGSRLCRAGWSLCTGIAIVTASVVTGVRTGVPVMVGRLEPTVSAQASNTTIWNGPYTDEQAVRGRQIYQQACAYCHLDDLSGFGGDTAAPALVGTPFFIRWDGRALGELFGLILETMPQDDPAIAPSVLTPEEYIDVVTFLLKTNGVPAGHAEALPDRQVLDGILITHKPDSRW